MCKGMFYLTQHIDAREMVILCRLVDGDADYTGHGNAEPA